MKNPEGSLISYFNLLVKKHGGYFLWAELPDRFHDGFEFALRLFEREKVAVVPGINFSPYKKNYIRMNFATDRSSLQKAVSRIRNFDRSFNG